MAFSSIGEIVFVAFFFLSLAWYWMNKTDGSAYTKSNIQTEKIRYNTLFFIFAIFISSIVFSYRYVYYPRPRGANTPDYIYISNLIFHQVGSDRYLLWGARVLIALVILSIRTLVKFLLGLSYLELVMITPIILGVAYSLSVYKLVKIGTNNNVLAIMALLATPMTFLTVRLSWDLYAQLFGLTLTTLFFSILKNYGRMDLK
jgi:magnesium-transporting ATPase (P-type)